HRLCSSAPKGALVNSQGRQPLVLVQNHRPCSSALTGRSSIARGVSPWLRTVAHCLQPQRGDSQTHEDVMPQSHACLHCHLIFSTKNRAPFLTANLQPRLYEYMGGILRGHKCCLVAAGGMPDHVHFLASLHRDVSVAEAVRLVKSNSSGWVHETFPDLAAF